jgi:hypothetical protein
MPGKKLSSALGKCVRVPRWKAPQCTIDAIIDCALSRLQSPGLFLADVFEHAGDGVVPVLNPLAGKDVEQLRERMAGAEKAKRELEAKIPTLERQIKALRTSPAKKFVRERRPLPSFSKLQDFDAEGDAVMEDTVDTPGATFVSKAQAQTRVDEFDTIIQGQLEALGEDSEKMLEAWLTLSGKDRSGLKNRKRDSLLLMLP